MNLKENVKQYDEVRKQIEKKKEIIAFHKIDYESKIGNAVAEIKELEEKLNTTFKDIEIELKEQFSKDKTVKKFYGGFAIQEKKKIEYKEEDAFKWCKEKDMFLTYDKKSFEKACEGLKLDFVKIDKESVQVTIPKEIKLED